MNPKLAPILEKEIQKLKDAHILTSNRYSNWVTNVMHKNNGEINICIDFRNLNVVSLKNNYPFPNMDL